MTIDVDKKGAKFNAAQDFTRHCRDSLKVTVKEFNFDPSAYREREKKRIELHSNLGKLQSVLTKACETHFSELY